MIAYIKTIIVAVFCISVFSSVLPKDKLGKYAKFIAGILLISVIITPFAHKINDFSFQLPAYPVEELQMNSKQYIKNEFETTLSVRIVDMLKKETGKSFQVKVDSMLDADGTISGIKKVWISPYSINYAEMVAEYVGITISEVAEIK